jgi:transcriptional regulator with XRE-family HTH domain
MDIRTLRLNEAFNASGMTQTELCAKTGITKGAISSFLSGRYFPKQKSLESLADALNVSIPYLMGYDEMEENDQAEAMLLEKVRKLSPQSRFVLDGIIDTLLEGDRNNGDKNNKQD